MLSQLNSFISIQKIGHPFYTKTLGFVAMSNGLIGEKASRYNSFQIA